MGKMYEIHHSAEGSHWAKKNHQYIKKIGTPPNVKYIYSAAQYAEYAKTKMAKEKRESDEDSEKPKRRNVLKDAYDAYKNLDKEPAKVEPVKVDLKGPLNTPKKPDSAASKVADQKKKQTEALVKEKTKEETKVPGPASAASKVTDAKKQQVDDAVKAKTEEETSKGKVSETKKDTTSQSSEDRNSYKSTFERMKAQFEEKRKKPEEGEEQASEEKKSGSSKKSGGSKKSSGGSSKSSSAAQNQNGAGESGSEDEELDRMALAVIRGEFGNGEDRKAALGEYYDIIQQRVNEIMRGARAASSGGNAAINQPTGAVTTNPTTSSASAPSAGARRETQAEKNPELAKTLSGIGVNINNMTDFQVNQMKRELEKSIRHSAAGTTWAKKNHLYTFKKNGKYYYAPEDALARVKDYKEGKPIYRRGALVEDYKGNSYVKGTGLGKVGEGSALSSGHVKDAYPEKKEDVKIGSSKVSTAKDKMGGKKNKSYYSTIGSSIVKNLLRSSGYGASMIKN